MKLKIIIAIIIAFIAWHFGWAWLLVFPLLLYGANGSVYKLVKHIPHEDDDRGIVYFNQDGESYRNDGDTTHKMIERGRDTWAGRQRASVNVELQKRRFRDD